MGKIEYYSFCSEKDTINFNQSGNSGDEMVVLFVYCIPLNDSDSTKFNCCYNIDRVIEISTDEQQLNNPFNFHDDISIITNPSQLIINIFLSFLNLESLKKYMDAFLIYSSC